jgi:chorismate mutase
MSISSKTGLDDIRREIDQLDQTLLKLIEERLAIAARVAASKGDGPHFRPGREAMILSQLAQQSSLDPLIIEGIWRQIMSANLSRQSVMRLVMSGQDHMLMPTVNWRFGVEATPIQTDNHAAALAMLAKGEADLAILPHWQNRGQNRGQDRGQDGGNDWIGDWQDDVTQDQRVWLVATAPFFPTPKLSPAALFSRHRPDASGLDVTLIWQHGEFIEKPGYHLDLDHAVGVFQKP